MWATANKKKTSGQACSIHEFDWSIFSTSGLIWVNSVCYRCFKCTTADKKQTNLVVNGSGTSKVNKLICSRNTHSYTPDTKCHYFNLG